jgi:predicted AlkP superfamily pyrophosphatase or phosphodiesterase
VRAFFLAAALLVSLPLAAAEPALVLFVTVDQLRGDTPWRLRDRFGEGGFRYLMDRGAVYADAHFRHSMTKTGPGHATLFTGSGPAGHGLVSNDWFDRELGRDVNCVEDTASPLLGNLPDEAANDPHSGRSPRRLTASTIGDELVLASAGRSRVFAASLKDRGAIVPAGRKGKAWWYEKTAGEFVSSRFYFTQLPGWVMAWNQASPAHRFLGGEWTLMHPRKSYRARDMDDRPFEKMRGTLGRTFPHPLGDRPGPEFYTALRYSPMADELLLDFVEEMMRQEQVGQSGETDLLAVSFSATDYIGHAFGPFSLEAEDNALRLDRTLARLLESVDAQVGLEHTLVVLTSDHGVAPAPEYMAASGFSAERHQPGRLVAGVNAALKAEFGTDRNLVLAFTNPSLYLDRAALSELSIDPARAERVAAETLEAEPGLRLALIRSDLLAGRVPPNEEARRLAGSFQRERSGDVLVAVEPFWYLSSEPDGEAAMHGSLHRYDTHVPLMIAGPGVAAQVIYRRVHPGDVAPTLSAYLGIAPPSGSSGKLLAEVLP